RFGAPGRPDGGTRFFSSRSGWRPVQELNPAGTETELEPAGRPHTMRRVRPQNRAGGSMADGSYNQFCPVAMAAEILCTRWTIVVLRELIAGSTRFNELRRGMPRMSPALLSQRLKALETAGIVMRIASTTDRGASEYQLTPAG